MIITPRPWPPAPPKGKPFKRYGGGELSPIFEFRYKNYIEWHDWINSQDWILDWGTHSIGSILTRSDVNFWISDAKHAKDIPRMLFGLPTTIYLRTFPEVGYRESPRYTDTLLERRFEGFIDKMIYRLAAWVYEF
jgi:hypothetical protein